MPMMIDVFTPRHDFEVLDSVIEFVPVLMVDYLKRLKIAAFEFFHHKTVFGHIASLSSERMIWLVNVAVSILIRLSSPLVIIFSSVPRIPIFFAALFGATKPKFSSFDPIWIKDDRLATPITRNRYLFAFPTSRTTRRKILFGVGAFLGVNNRVKTFLTTTRASYEFHIHTIAYALG